MKKLGSGIASSAQGIAEDRSLRSPVSRDLPANVLGTYELSLLDPLFVTDGLHLQRHFMQHLHSTRLLSDCYFLLLPTLRLRAARRDGRWLAERHTQPYQPRENTCTLPLISLSDETPVAK